MSLGDPFGVYVVPKSRVLAVEDGAGDEAIQEIDKGDFSVESVRSARDAIQKIEEVTKNGALVVLVASNAADLEALRTCLLAADQTRFYALLVVDAVNGPKTEAGERIFSISIDDVRNGKLNDKLHEIDRQEGTNPGIQQLGSGGRARSTGNW